MIISTPAGPARSRSNAATAMLWLLAAVVLASSCGRAFAQDPAAPNPDEHPFQRKFPLREFPAGLEWMNTRPLKLQNLRGKFVLLDFWTYCCINCIHILPELKKLEQKYGDQLVVIGVHSAKFETEKNTKNISEAILRYEIEHPVINDKDHLVWQSLGVSSWPTVILIDPEGNAVWGQRGEIKSTDVSQVLDRALPYYRKQKLLDETPVRFELLAYDATETPLRFPGKLLADGKGNRLLVSDSNHNRIVIANLAGEHQATIGSGAIGKADGAFEAASFNHPQGMALHEDTLYVADTENHLLRKVDLKTRKVKTIAGVGEQAKFPWPGLDKLRDELPERWVGAPLTTALNSPWALWVHKDALYIAMAGPHQIWKMPLDESEIGPYAGSSREDITDGRLLPELPPQLGRFFPGSTDASAFAQPSGLTSDGTWLYVADSEGSSIRAVPFDGKQTVRTVVGTAELEGNRLFTFGDVDGPRDSALLQHALGVTYSDGKIYVADTYNNKIKVVDAESGATKTLAGSGKPGRDDGASEAATFDEPAGVSFAAGKLYVADTNNHAIRVVDPSTGAVSTLELKGLEPPKRGDEHAKPEFTDAEQVALPPATIAAQDGKLKVRMQLTMPLGWKLNPLAPWECWVEAKEPNGPVARAALGHKAFEGESVKLEFSLAVSGDGEQTLVVSLPYYYCSDGGLCKVGSVVWTAPVKIAADAKDKELVLPLKVNSF
ncbi:MAG: redoxin domain-containing protein [Planctomycetales bacterium]|nr:redoxin domain-containing protein [Planctomycetales bacterium]